MATLDDARATQLASIQKRTGKTLAELTQIVLSSGLVKHGERVAMLKSTLGMGHGDANALVHYVATAQVLDADAGSEGAALAVAPEANRKQVLDELYIGSKAALRPIHDQLLQALQKFGAFEEAPKKTYVSYRRKKQFAMIGPATNTRVELGLNVKGLAANPRLQELPAGQMCNFKVKLSEAGEVDQDVIAWMKAAYEAAG